MGGKNSHQISRLDEKNWVPTKSNPEDRFHNVNSFASRSLKNVHTNEQIEQYHVEFISQAQYTQYIRDLVIRKQPGSMGMGMEGQSSTQNYHELSPYIYTVKRFINVSMVDLCSTLHKGLLYAKKVDLRLKEINDIPLADQLYMTKATLEGFKILYQKMGYFDIIEQMIFIDKRGRIRVWVNPNLSQNVPYLVRTSNTRQLYGSQSQMIVNLLNMIEDNADHMYEQNIHFREYLINKGIFERLSFYQALDQFELYCLEEKLQVGAYMPSIEELYHPEGGIQESTQIVSRQQFRQRNVFHPAPDVRSQYKSPDRNQYSSPARNLQPISRKVESKGLIVTSGAKNMYQSQTDKRSIQSNQMLYRSNHEISQQSSRKTMPEPHQPLTANYRQTTPQFGQKYRQIPSNSTMVRASPILPPRPQRLNQQQISFRAVELSKVNSNLNSQRSSKNIAVSRSSAEKTNTLVKFNYNNNGMSNTSKPAAISSYYALGNDGKNNVLRTPDMSHHNSIQSVQSSVKNVQNQVIVKTKSSGSAERSPYMIAQPQPHPKILSQPQQLHPQRQLQPQPQRQAQIRPLPSAQLASEYQLQYKPQPQPQPQLQSQPQNRQPKITISSQPKPQPQQQAKQTVYTPPEAIYHAPEPMPSPPKPQPTNHPQNQVSYYSSDETFKLDSQIAADLKVLLGYNPSE